MSLTEAGQQLFERLFPLYQAINHEVDALGDFLDTPSGLIRINASAVAAEAVLSPKLKPLLQQYSKIRLEIVVDNRRADIVCCPPMLSPMNRFTSITPAAGTIPMCSG